ncbi:hypothetical protein ACIQAC_26080 [Streptomyces sp. NPDC088387]|uniref:hypothetical protein n=1 Tax=Streptomyces sp. NPDC088387 TaxID=3365859 RepID=UPI0037F4622D
MPPSRPVRAVRRATVAVALLLAAATGCGDAGDLRAAGATPTASMPELLWPDLAPASSPAFPLEEADRETVKGVTPPGDDLRRVDPAALVRAEIAANPGDYRGSKAPYRGTASRMGDCDDGGGGDGCPLLTPYYRDLTGDGHEDLTLGFRLLPGKLTAVRVYTVEHHRIVEVMSWDDAFSSVELAQRSLIMRLPSDVAGYDYRLQWTWDPEQRAMLLTHDEMVRTDGKTEPPAKPSTSPGSTTPTPTPTATPTPSPASTAPSAR